jgi:hypothetical protein
MVALAHLNTTPDPSLAEEERLDAIDPLRHLCSADDSELLPSQPPSLGGQIIQINIEAPHRTITLSLAVDASPGCGGIAWPAGEVRPCVPRVAYHHIHTYFFLVVFYNLTSTCSFVQRASFVGISDIHCPPWIYPPWFEDPRTWQWHRPRRPCSRLSWRPCMHHRPGVSYPLHLRGHHYLIMALDLSICFAFLGPADVDPLFRSWSATFCSIDYNQTSRQQN